MGVYFRQDLSIDKGFLISSGLAEGVCEADKMATESEADILPRERCNVQEAECAGECRCRGDGESPRSAASRDRESYQGCYDHIIAIK